MPLTEFTKSIFGAPDSNFSSFAERLSYCIGKTTSTNIEISEDYTASDFLTDIYNGKYNAELVATLSSDKLNNSQKIQLINNAGFGIHDIWANAFVSEMRSGNVSAVDFYKSMPEHIYETNGLNIYYQPRYEFVENLLCCFSAECHDTADDILNDVPTEKDFTATKAFIELLKDKTFYDVFSNVNLYNLAYSIMQHNNIAEPYAQQIESLMQEFEKSGKRWLTNDEIEKLPKHILDAEYKKPYEERFLSKPGESRYGTSFREIYNDGKIDGKTNDDIVL